jgi:hypothetical protein
MMFCDGPGANVSLRVSVSLCSGSSPVRVLLSRKS